MALPRLAFAQTSPANAPAPHTQPPVPVAETRFDVDGDGTADRIRIERPPAVTVQLAGGRQAWKPFATSTGTLVAGTLTTTRRAGGGAVVVATAVFRAGRGEHQEAMVLAWQGRELVKLWEGAVGLQGADGEYALHVEATPQGLLRYQTRPEVYRCDGQPAYLYPEGYDFRAGRFRPVFNTPRIAADAPVLVAQPTPPPGGDTAPIPAVAFRTSAASTQSGAAHAGQLAPPRALDDGNPATVWREGLGGDGRGELITLTTTMDQVRVAAVRIVPGDASSAELFRRGNRLRRAGLLVGADRAFWIELPADPARALAGGAAHAQPYWVTLPEPVAADCVTLIIDAVYPGSGAGAAHTGDTALADLAVLTDLDLTPGGPEAALVARVRAGGSPGRTAMGLLALRGRHAAEALVHDAGASGRAPDELLRLRRALARVGDAVGAGELVEGLADAHTPAADREDFARVLARMGADAVGPVAALLGDATASEAAHQAAAEALGAMADAGAREALASAAGRGSRAVRRTVALRLGQRDAAELPALLDAAMGAAGEGEAGREADLWRAVGVMARRADAAARARAAAVMAARLETASGYELLYRLLPAAAGLELASADAAPVRAAMQAAVSAALARVPAGDAADGAAGGAAGDAARTTSPRARAEADALRRVTASALGQNPAAWARALLTGMLAAPDPGLRRRAADALAGRDDGTDESDRALAARLQDDAWPRVRVLAATALGRRCGAAADAAAALDRALGSDAEEEVRRAALAAMVMCQAPGIGARLLAVAGDGAQPASVRGRAITLMPVHGERDPAGRASGLVPGLIDLFARLRERAWSDAAALRLATTAAATLGRLGDARAVEPLLGAARDEAFPELQAAAITGLGSLCPAAAMPLFERWASSPQRAVALAARAARDHCR